MAQRALSEMGRNDLENRRQQLQAELNNPNVNNAMRVQTQQLINYINVQIRNRNRVGGRTRRKRAKKSKKSMRRRR